jgi:MFS family permease
VTCTDVHREDRAAGTFGSLRIANYRRYAAGQVVSLIGTWMQRVAQDWLVLELSGGSPVALGVAAALQFGPVLVLSLWAGVLADRMDKRRLLIAAQLLLGTFALILGLLDVSGMVTLWQVYALCLLLGCASALETPVRQSFVVEMVGRAQLPNAVALNATTFNTARIVGPAVAGVAVTVIGTGWLFLINALTFLATVTALTGMDTAALHRSDAVPRRRGQLREGLRYVRGRADVTLVLALVFCVGTFGLNFYMTLAIMARNVFHHGAASYGLLSTLLAVGTLTGAVLAARRTGHGTGTGDGVRPLLGMVVVSAAVFGALEVAVGLMPSYLAFGLMLVPTGAAALTFTTAANSAVQLSVAPTMRGRVMALYMLLFLGGTPLGGPLVGWLAAEFGGRAPFVAGGVVSFVAAVGCGLALRRALTPRPRARYAPDPR